MSVNISKRTENPLEVHVRAVELAAYTYKICDNEKVFKPIHKGLVIKIEEIVTDIYCKAWNANNIRVKDGEGWAERANLQKGNTKKHLAKMDKFYKELLKGVEGNVL